MDLPEFAASQQAENTPHDPPATFGIDLGRDTERAHIVSTLASSLVMIRGSGSVRDRIDDLLEEAIRQVLTS